MTERGFTLIELLIAVAIIAILAAVAYPTYTEHTRKIRRSQIAAVLVEEAHKLERFHSRAGQYSDVTGPPAREHAVSEGNGFYVIEAKRSEQMFVLKAMPIGGTLMSGDKCGAFVLENTGRRDNQGMSGDASVQGCWGR
ncbi:type IV pilin protein [Pseudomonas sp. LP_7_YM]|uniref:type IV pilin protein n=1 Tax=Pseudomonas sp. LP_7_YM TaxID=2485137 RepID=UPI00105CB589|nr:type IV pilin protein [Pseudomonas sp. LP_7_YM]TDV65790.1 type IV pilus assembly protein PilE [Pseudomonas sp. LP_7_YM]